MHEAVARLTHVLTRPAVGPSKDWTAVAQHLGTDLPRDYKDFIEVFGGGHLDDHLYVLEPDCPNENYDLVDNVEERTEALDYLWSSSEDKPAEAAQPGARLIAWASTDNGEFAYWLALPGQTPDEWTVMVNEEGGEWWEHFTMGFGQFLSSVLTGDIRSEILAYTFPKAPHTFNSYADPSWQG